MRIIKMILYKLLRLSDEEIINYLIEYARIKGYRIFENNSKNYNLNIWAIRSNNQHAGYFDDLELVFWKDIGGRWRLKVYTCTTDPSDHYLINPINPQGTAILKPGQHNTIWELGHHRGDKRHPALVQSGNRVTVVRDFNKDIILDYQIPGLDDYDTIETERHDTGYITKYYKKKKLIFTTDTGYFGINNHRAHINKVKKQVGLYSAGCIVQNDPHKYIGEFIPIIRRAVNSWGNSFTFTLVTECSLLENCNINIPNLIQNIKANKI